jgi:hypothetical protein
MNILDGPNRETLMDSFARRLPIVVEITTRHMHRMLLLNELRHEDGSGKKFIFKTVEGVEGYYDTEERTGVINV